MNEPQQRVSPSAGETRPQLPWPLVGFYLSCAGVALGATIASAGFLWFESIGALVTGIVMTTVCAVACYRSLCSLRR